MVQRRGRSQLCGPPEAQRRLAHARIFLEVAELTAVKDAAHYGFISVTASQLKRSLRQAQHLVEFAEGVLQRRSGSG